MRTAELKLLKTFGHLPGQCKTFKVPLADHSQWSSRGFKTGVKGLSDVKMSSLLGAALWIRRGVRLDLSVALHKLSLTKDTERFEQEHRAHQLLGYLSATVGLGLLFRRTAGTQLQLWPDASWGGDAGRRSRAGYVITIGGAAIAWTSYLLKGVKRSTAEAEYGAAYRCASDFKGISNLITELRWSHVPLKGIQIMEDSAAAIAIMQGGPVSKSSKTYEIEQYWLTDEVKQGHFTVTKVDSANQLGDLFTKPLSPQVFLRIRDRMMTM